MPRPYDEQHPVINTNLIKIIKNSREEYTDDNIDNLLTEIFNAEFIIATSNNGPVFKDVYDMLMLSDEFGVYLPIFTNYFEMRKMKETTKHQAALIYTFDEIIDLVFSLFDVDIKGIIIDPFGTNLYFNTKLLESLRQIMHVQQKSKIIEEVKQILAYSEFN